MSWKTVLSDKAKFADDKKITFEGVEMTLGELRTLNAETQGELARKMEEVGKQRADLEAKQAEAAKFYQTVLEEKQRLTSQAAAQPAAANANAAQFDPFSDPAWQPVMKPIAERLAKAEANAKQVEDLRKAILDIATVWTRDRWHREYSALPELKDDKGQARYQLEQLVKKAEAEKLVDPITGIYDIRAAYDRLEEPRKLEALKKQAFEEGKKAAEQAAFAAAMPRPGESSFTIQSTPAPGSNGKALSFDEAVQRAMSDPEIISNLQQGL